MTEDIAREVCAAVDHTEAYRTPLFQEAALSDFDL